MPATQLDTRLTRYDLEGRRVLVSGAGRGLGRSASEHLGRCGAVVGVSDVDAESCEQTADLIRQAGGRAYAFPADLSKRVSFCEVGAAFAKAAGRIDAVVNNASVLHYETIEEVREERLEQMVAVGLKASVWGAQVLLAHFDSQVGGSVINFGSPVAYKGFPGTSIYSAVKGSLVALTRALAVELGPRGVRVNAIAPGSVPTPGAVKYVGRAEYDRRAATIPLRRLGTEQDHARALAFLLSNEAAFMTGTVLHVDGGIVAAG